MKLQNKVALITGGNGKIGQTIAEWFVREGCQVLLAGRTATELTEINAHLAMIPNARVSLAVANVGKPASVAALMQLAGKAFGRIDILVTAAGVYGEIGPVSAADPERWLEAVTINLYGTMLCIKYAVPLLQKSSKPRIISFAGGGEGPVPNFSSYVSSKGAVLRLVETVAVELAPLGIAINAISPGLVNSGFVQDLIIAGPERAGTAAYQAAQAQVAGTAETVSPEKAAALAVWLAGEAPAELTGKNLSAVWDNWRDISSHINEIASSDIYNLRRVKPKDRGYQW